jgi:hypothetical protein
MLDESALFETHETEGVGEIELPRWVQVPIGVILRLFTLPCALASKYLSIRSE